MSYVCDYIIQHMTLAKLCQLSSFRCKHSLHEVDSRAKNLRRSFMIVRLTAVVAIGLGQEFRVSCHQYTVTHSLKVL